MFNKLKFKELILKARGNRTNEDYSKESGVSRSYISNLVNSKLDSPPSPDIIKKLADKAHNEVNYEQLMMAAGHLVDVTRLTSNPDVLDKYLPLEQALSILKGYPNLSKLNELAFRDKEGNKLDLKDTELKEILKELDEFFGYKLQKIEKERKWFYECSIICTVFKR